jgi:predicted DNA-binding transcriptional regulator AlpA
MPAESFLPIRAALDAIPPPTVEDRPKPERTAPPLLVDITCLSELLQRSLASLYRDDAAGRLPAGLKIGGSKRWRYSEIVAWVEAGCPPRREWEARRAASNASGRPRQAGR